MAETPRAAAWLAFSEGENATGLSQREDVEEEARYLLEPLVTLDLCHASAEEEIRPLKI